MIGPQFLQSFLTISIIAFAYIVWKQNRSTAINLLNVKTSQLREVFTSDDPSIIYCATHSTKLNVPAATLDAHKLLGPAYSLIALNCSQKLHSGQDIWSKFHLNDKWVPTVFAYAPWASAKQINPAFMRDGITLSKHIQDMLEPQAEDVHTNDDFQAKCGPDNDGKSCIVFMKGLRFTAAHNMIIKKIIMAYHKARVIIIDAGKQRLSFENPKLSPENFTMKVYVVKSNYYVKMVASPTLPNIQSFLYDAMHDATLATFSGNGTMKVVDAVED